MVDEKTGLKRAGTNSRYATHEHKFVKPAKTPAFGHFADRSCLVPHIGETGLFYRAGHAHNGMGCRVELGAIAMTAKHVAALGAFLCVVCLSGAAQANPLDSITGYVSTGFGNVKDGSLGTFHDANLTGAVAMPLGISNLGVQLDANGDHAWASGGSSSIGGFGGDILWSDNKGRMALSLQSHDTFHSHFNSYGFGGEWFAARYLTLAFKTGVLNKSSVWYGGGEIRAYVFPDLALTGSIDYSSFPSSRHESDVSGNVEYLVSRIFPAAVFTGFSVSTITGAKQITAWNIGLKIYLNGDSDSSLVERQRGGPADYITSYGPPGLKF
jgi:hypothetical protein